MNVGDKIRVLKKITWEETTIPRGTTGKITRVGTSGAFIALDKTREEVYAFKEEIELLPITSLLKVRTKAGKTAGAQFAKEENHQFET